MRIFRKLLLLAMLCCSSSAYGNTTFFVPLLHDTGVDGNFANAFSLDVISGDNQDYLRLTNNFSGENGVQAYIRSVFILVSGQPLFDSAPQILDADNSANLGVDFYLKREFGNLNLPAGPGDGMGRRLLLNPVSQFYLFEAVGNNQTPFNPNRLFDGLNQRQRVSVRDVDSSQGDSRVEAGESLDLLFGSGFDIMTALSNRNLMIGIQVQYFPGTGSDLMVNEVSGLLFSSSPVPAIPVPGAMVLGLIGLHLIRTRKSS